MIVERLELRLLRLPLVRHFETSFGRSYDRLFLLVRVDGGGHTGWGECVAEHNPYYSSETTETAWHVISEFIAPLVVGAEFAHPRDIFPALARVRGHFMAKGVVEMAAWDLYARQQQQPLWQVLGGSGKPVASGVSIGIQDSLDELVERVAIERDAGYQRIKIKIKPGWDVDAVTRLRDQFGAIPLMVDANAAYTLADAAHLARLDAFDLMMIEQPLDYDDIADHAALQRRIATPVCLDESITSARLAIQALETGACRIINIKPGRLGGFAESIRVHDACASHGVPVWHGGMLESGIGRAANLHLSTLPNFRLPGDIAASRRYYEPDVIDPPIDIRPDGTVAVPADGPGLGVRIVDSRLELATLRRMEIAEAVNVRLTVSALSLTVLAACASVPPPAPVVVPTEPPLATIIRLEDQRVLRDPAPAPAPPAIEPTSRRGVTVAPAPPPPDLIALLSDSSARTRRRAALAIGRVGLAEGVAPLLARLANDPELEVRQMSAFALGLLGRREAILPLRTALADASPIVRGRAAEALGLIGDTEGAAAIGAMVGTYVKAGALSSVVADESGHPLSPEIEATRLGLYALARLKAYEPLAAAVLDAKGVPVTRWWPVAYAFRRVGDAKAAPVLRALAQGDGTYTRAFAARGLGVVKDRGAFELLRSLAANTPGSPIVGVEAIRALAELADPRALTTLSDLLKVRGLHDELRAEVVRAIGALRVQESTDLLLDMVTDRAPAVRAEAFGALVASDPERFIITLSGLDPDTHWTVRAAVATALAELPVETAAPLLEPMARDADHRVRPAVLAALAKRNTPGAAAIALEALKVEDPVVRGAAAAALAVLKPAGAVEALQAAAVSAQRDELYVARAGALSALAKFGAAAAQPELRTALADKDWAVRLRAAQLLRELDPASDEARAIRPAPARVDRAVYGSPAIIAPPVSTHVFIDTDKGTVQIELAVLDAPLTVRSFTDLAQSGHFDGVAIHRVVANFVVQDGDPRGDGEGGPGYTIRDELNQRPYVRGTVGMALDWADTGGSQFFITHSPQPHLDARYTVFGQVLAGMDVVDQLSRGDVIRHVRVWNGGTE